MSGTRRKPGWIGPFVEEFGQLGRWMAREELGAAELSSAAVEEVLAALRASGCRRVPTGRSFAPLLDLPAR